MIPPTAGHHLLSIEDLGGEGILEVLRVADAFAEVGRRRVPKVQALRGRSVVSLFAEESTRTRLSFETAARRLSADVMTFAMAASSVKKGESLRDTVETLASMGVDAFVVRHPSSGVPLQVARWLGECGSRASVVNAGDGFHEHPTQALLDCYTIAQVLAERALPGSKGIEAWLAADPDPLTPRGAGIFTGLRVTIVGDVRHSRVARSEILALVALGARITLVAPSSLLPPSLDGWPVADVSYALDPILPHTDVCYLLRMQAERGTGSLVPSMREYATGYGLTARRAAALPDDAIVMHPGPMNRGVEIASEVADMPMTLVRRQVANGISVRMAVLYLLMGADAAPSPDTPDGPDTPDTPDTPDGLGRGRRMDG
ncbi:MAG: aspartate carbamoyltransferase catalytic subunit [Acidimicrobiales bacterium]